MAAIKSRHKTVIKKVPLPVPRKKVAHHARPSHPSPTPMATKKEEPKKEETAQSEPRRCPAPETVDQTKLGSFLQDEDRERFLRQGDKGEEG